jgi:hypothetical protein
MNAQIPSIETLIHKLDGRADAPVRTTRKCPQCGTEYDVRRQGKGGGLARDDDATVFPYDEKTMTGVRPETPHWFHGDLCSDECYEAAYYEPPFPYGP